MSTVSAGVLPAGTSEERISYLLGAIATTLQQIREKSPLTKESGSF
jgi:hypothetical protein